MPKNPTKPNQIYLIYMYKADLAFDNLKALICHKINSSTENDVNLRIDKAWTDIDRLMTMWKPDRYDKIKQEFSRL